jgi:GntR family transcriptional regulator
MPLAKHSNSPLPLYFKVMIDLQEKILSGEWPRGAHIPGEIELAKDLGVSVITVRQALGQLVQEGYIHRERAKGSFVSWKRPLRQFVSLDVEAEDLVTVSPQTLFKLISVEQAQVPLRLKEKLQLKGDASVSKIVRVRLSDKQPIAYVISYVPFQIGSLIPEKGLVGSPLPKAVETFSSVRITEVTHTVGAVLSDPEASFHLEIPTGSPVLMVERDYLSKKVTVMVSIGYYRSDLFRYELRLKRKEAQ